MKLITTACTLIDILFHKICKITKVLAISICQRKTLQLGCNHLSYSQHFLHPLSLYEGRSQNTTNPSHECYGLRILCLLFLCTSPLCLFRFFLFNHPLVFAQRYFFFDYNLLIHDNLFANENLDNPTERVCHTDSNNEPSQICHES